MLAVSRPERQPFPRLRSLPPLARGRNGGTKGSGSAAARAVRHLLALRQDDPQLAQLAAAAVLVAGSSNSSSFSSSSILRAGLASRCNSGFSSWCTEEMELQLAEVWRLESAWLSSLGSLRWGLGSNSDPAPDEQVLRASALYAAFCEMEAAVRGQAPLPQRDELLVCVARGLLGGDFTDVGEVEAAVGKILASPGCGSQRSGPPSWAMAL